MQEKETSLANLLAWMEEEMTVRLRSGATIRKGSSSYQHGVHAVGGGNNSQKSGSYKGNNANSPMLDSPKTQYYVCKDMHYVDQCPQFKSMTPMQRWEIVKEQKACFSCLKRSKGHTASNCLRKNECQEKPMTVPVVRILTTGFYMATQVLIPVIQGTDLCRKWTSN